MLTLVLVVCLSAAPNICREEEPPVTVVSPMSCVMQGQLLALEWLEDHPKWRLASWRCEAGARGKDA